jgi:hypothetical protein
MNTQQRQAPPGGNCSLRAQKPHSWSSDLSKEPLNNVIRRASSLGVNEFTYAAKELGADCFIVLFGLLGLLGGQKLRHVALGANQGGHSLGDAFASGCVALDQRVLGAREQPAKLAFKAGSDPATQCLDHA